MSVADHVLPPVAVRPSPKGYHKTGLLKSLSPRTPVSRYALPAVPETIEEIGLPLETLYDLTLKLLHQHGMLTGGKIAVKLCLRFGGLVETVLRDLKQKQLVAVIGGQALNPVSYRYELTADGLLRVREARERNRYVGPCPVSLEQYIRQIKAQAKWRPQISPDQVARALRNLVLLPEAINRIGPAVMSFKSLFLYGPPGNGKTSIAKAIGRHLLGEMILVPHAIFADGQVIKVYDPEIHQVVAEPETDETPGTDKFDQRWLHCRPPQVIVGGELTLADLDLVYKDTARYYEAPLQLKANGGMFLIDDFGRQRMEPKELLNRWIVPLEEQLDYLTFDNGKKIAVPFETFIIFSTNLNPEKLVDGAFLRRILHKLGIDNPNRAQFYRIFEQACRQYGFKFDKESFIHLARHYYEETGRPYQACHARDLLKLVMVMAQFRGEPIQLTIRLIDEAAGAYFTPLF